MEGTRASLSLNRLRLVAAPLKGPLELWTHRACVPSVRQANKWQLTTKKALVEIGRSEGLTQNLKEAIG